MFRFSHVRKELAERGIDVLSAGTDEVPGVYKDIRQVMAAQQDLVEIVAQFDPEDRQDVRRRQRGGGLGATGRCDGRSKANCGDWCFPRLGPRHGHGLYRTWPHCRRVRNIGEQSYRVAQTLAETTSLRCCQRRRRSAVAAWANQVLAEGPVDLIINNAAVMNEPCAVVESARRPV